MAETIERECELVPITRTSALPDVANRERSSGPMLCIASHRDSAVDVLTSAFGEASKLIEGLTPLLIGLAMVKVPPVAVSVMFPVPAVAVSVEVTPAVFERAGRSLLRTARRQARRRGRIRTTVQGGDGALP